MTHNTKFLFLSFIIGLLFTALSGLVGPRCKLVEPGGVADGWRGLPLPYYQCGTWGDTLYTANQCIQGKISVCDGKDDNACKVSKVCIVEKVGTPLVIILIDISFWALMAYFVIKKLEKRYKRPTSAEIDTSYRGPNSP